MAIFNRGITDDNRKIIAKALAELLDITEPVPESFNGIPIVNNQRTWFFGYHYKRHTDDIDILWEVFARAIAFADLEDEGESEEAKSQFFAAYDSATNCYGIGWNLTMGLYWIRPWSFLTLDGQSQEYINKKLNIEINKNGPKARCDAHDYLELLESLETRFLEETYPVHSFPELSLAAYQFKPNESEKLSNRTWKEIIFSQLKQLCHDKDSLEFTDNEFLDRFTDALKERFPKRSDVKGTVKFLLKELASDGELELLSKGTYRWLDKDTVSNLDTQLPFKTDTQMMLETYSIDNITSDGCFLPKAKIEL